MTVSVAALRILETLDKRHNVLLSGPPSCGKTHLMQEVADAFKTHVVNAPPSGPRSAPARIAIPAAVPIATPQATAAMPSAGRGNRNVERIAFAANTKPRDFTTAFVPVVGGALGIGSFRVETGALIRANQYALGGGAALLIIDELNRGPAVQLFGDAIVAIEPDKRLDANDKETANSWPLRILGPTGAGESVFLSKHLYILSSINMADSSIEPLDVAFLRRFEIITISPDAAMARAHLGASGSGTALPAIPSSAQDVVELAVRAWVAVNDRITIGRSPDFQLGHGIFMDRPTAPTGIQDALAEATGWWRKIHNHVREVFYGDTIGIGIALNAGTDPAGYQILNAPYGQDERQRLVEPTIDSSTVYGLLKLVAGA